MALSKAEILSRPRVRVKEVPVPEWGEAATVFVRTLSGAERDAWEESLVGSGTGKDRKANIRNVRARFAVLTAADSEGNRLFADADADELGARESKPLDRIWEAGRQWNGMTDTDVEEIEKNSAGAPNGVSGSGSPAT